MTAELNGVRLTPSKAERRGEKVFYSYKKLKGRIVEKYCSQKNFAKCIGISNVALSRKMNGKTGFSQKDIVEWAKKLDISRDEYAEYFFN